MLLKNPVPICPKPTILEHNFIDFTSEPASAATTSKKMPINLTMQEFETAQVEPVKPQKIQISDEICHTLEQIRNKVGKLREMYLQKKKKSNSTGEGSSAPDFISDTENLDDKENHETETDKPQKKKRRSGIDSLSEVIAAMSESRNRFYEKKIYSKLQESQKRFKLEKKKLNQQYELEKNKLEIKKLQAENKKVKLELEMLKFHKNN
ncbi:hypothetical protein C1645_833878 [Glomus cerebriforme]|uniref:Uncharacterized protein n=1 Tax=Glomus cerebriforme TaxID=658196 RepID=A0A397SAR0_9GLOM|nr:hypothetical protein C1645_833878 [Glomus cerebriforme]